MQFYIQTIKRQRDTFYKYVASHVDDTWERPLPEKWSVGETLYHLVLMVRLVRRFSILYLPVMTPYAKVCQSRSYKTETYNIHEEYTQVKKSPMKAPVVLTLPKKLGQKYHFTDVKQLLDSEPTRLKDRLSHVDERVAGQIRYPDPLPFTLTLFKALIY